ncbi:serine protease [Parabacteroides bouchesdurhonensis]|uniref:serine protease n=1 Tax=Parabacteroides bouchesdurhonensis TaxID=1936995 RepID=UPI000E4C0861|nr:serine protease [Parabacteroides bouchesdurhonensis]RHJ95262.1 serine protease [Bacteroides sp. AM07-16]
MKRILLFVLICCYAVTLAAQKKAPKWMEKEKNAVLTVTTYKNDNTVLHKGTGFFISETGEALSAYSLFKNAHKATVTDAGGNTMPVSLILGADELYDVIKFQVSAPKKVTFFPLVSVPLQVDEKVYLLPYTTGKVSSFEEGQIIEVSKLKDSYNYYKVSFPLEASEVNSPLLNEKGEVFGLAQEDASGKKENSYAVSAGYANSLALTSADAFNITYTNIGIRKAWPKEADQALVSLYLLSGTQDAKEYLNTLNDFIAHFPNTADGYQNRASHYAHYRAQLASSPAEEQKYLDLALEDIATAGKFMERKSDMWFNKAKLIYSVSADTTLTNDKWTVDAAQEALQQAIKEDDQPLYHQLMGDIYFSRQNYEEAYNNYMKVNNSNQSSPSSFYMAAKARENMPSANFGELIMLLDSAVAKCGTTPSPEAATFVLERVDLRMRLMQYKEAIDDYNLYFNLMGGKVSDSFYYYREQAKFRQGDLAGALADIQMAIKMKPQDSNYYAEEASVYVRMQTYDKALESIDKALKIAPDFAACYRLKGVCFIRQEKKAEACEAFQKAKELGDPVADKLIKEHCR